ncbi:unnamed protein product, partial [Urochloa humidicola]
FFYISPFADIYSNRQSERYRSERSFNYSELSRSRSYPLASAHMPMAAAAARKVSVPAILLALSVLSCLLLVHAAAAAAGNRKALLPRWADAGDDGGQVLPTTAEEAAVGAAGGAEPHHLLADDEMVEARRAELLQTQDYPGSGANSRHDPRNPH